MFTLSPRANGIVGLVTLVPLWFIGPFTFVEHTFKSWFITWLIIGVACGLFAIVPYFIYEVVTNRE